MWPLFPLAAEEKAQPWVTTLPAYSSANADLSRSTSNYSYSQECILLSDLLLLGSHCTHLTLPVFTSQSKTGDSCLPLQGGCAESHNELSQGMDPLR